MTSGTSASTPPGSTDPGAWPDPVRRVRRIGGIDHALYEWPGDGTAAETVVLLHGWMDTGRAFAPLVAALDPGRRYLAADWRGFGDSGWAADGRYLIPDYLADLDALLAAEAPDGATLIGHSLGGNVAGLYAGCRPERVRRLIALEAFGLIDQGPEATRRRYTEWLDSLGQRPTRRFRSAAALAARIRRRNPRLTPAMAAFLAGCWSRPADDGVVLRADPAHYRPNPLAYRLTEALACWRRIRAPTLWVLGGASDYARHLRESPDWSRRRGAIAGLCLAELPGCGHALTHEAPRSLASVIEAWWR